MVRDLREKVQERVSEQADLKRVQSRNGTCRIAQCAVSFFEVVSVPTDQIPPELHVTLLPGQKHPRCCTVLSALFCFQRLRDRAVD